MTEAHSEPNRTSKMELSTKMGNGYKPLAILAQSSILDVRLEFEYASECVCQLCFF